MSVGEIGIMTPCTTFSPAAHMAVRSYKQPREFEPSLPKTYALGFAPTRLNVADDPTRDVDLRPSAFFLAYGDWEKTT